LAFPFLKDLRRGEKEKRKEKRVFLRLSFLKNALPLMISG